MVSCNDRQLKVQSLLTDVHIFRHYFMNECNPFFINGNGGGKRLSQTVWFAPLLKSGSHKSYANCSFEMFQNPLVLNLSEQRENYFLLRGLQLDG